jgi:hypothetical protein
MTKGALIKNSGTIAKICTSPLSSSCSKEFRGKLMIASMALPKAIEKMSTELGGLSALQREGKSLHYMSGKVLIISREYHRFTNAIYGCKA